jgi:hypothetical protein
LRVKILLTVSFIAAVTFWGLTAAAVDGVRSLDGQGRMAVIMTVALASHLTWLTLLLHLRREKRTNERLQQIEAEYRRREAALIKTIQRLAGAPTTGPQRRLWPVASGERR